MNVLSIRIEKFALRDVPRGLGREFAYALIGIRVFFHVIGNSAALFFDCFKPVYWMKYWNFREIIFSTPYIIVRKYRCFQFMNFYYYFNINSPNFANIYCVFYKWKFFNVANFYKFYSRSGYFFSHRCGCFFQFKRHLKDKNLHGASTPRFLNTHALQLCGLHIHLSSREVESVAGGRKCHYSRDDGSREPDPRVCCPSEPEPRNYCKQSTRDSAQERDTHIPYPTHSHALLQPSVAVSLGGIQMAFPCHGSSEGEEKLRVEFGEAV